MKPKREPEVIELDANQLQARLDQIEQAMGEETARPFRQLLSWYLSLLTFIEQKNATIVRLRRLLFGARTERSRDVEPQGADSSTDAADRSSGDGSPASDGGDE